MEKKNITYKIEFLNPFWFLIGITTKGICILNLSYKKESLLQELSYIQNDYTMQQPIAKQEKLINDILREIAIYLKNPTYSLIHLKCDIDGTLFQKIVWEEIRKISVGKTLFYGDISKKIERPNSFRAVGNACANNKIALIIPCHRVIAKGNKQNYRWGIDIKTKLLQQEKQALFSEL